jgi:hypothetical protein
MTEPMGGTAAMAKCIAVRTVIAVGTLGLAATGCLEPFAGSSLQANISGTVAPEGTHESGILFDGSARPPANTYYTWYAVDEIYQRDAEGKIVRDGDGNPVVETAYVFEVAKFEIKPVVDVSSPCFIELPNTAEPNIPGLHATQFMNAMSQRTGITDPLNPPADAPEGDIIDMLGAQRRMGLLGPLATQVKAITSFPDDSAGYPQYPPVADTCVEDDPGYDRAEIPPPNCINEESNALRLELCQAFWDAHPFYYEGSDKVFTLPLNGQFLGVVTGVNPVNQGFLGGSSMFVDPDLSGIDVLMMNYQYKDLDGDGQPDYPAGVEPSELGFHFMSGRPESRTRGVINFSIRHFFISRISAEVAVFPDLDSDDVNF